MEILFKVFLTLIVLFFCFGSIKWIWFNQIDIKETITGILNKPQKSMEWVATRDPTKIYQDGKIVGNISGGINESDSQIVFLELCDTEGLNANNLFEYKRDKLKIKSIGSSIGMMGASGPSGAIAKKAVLMNVVCDRIK